MAKYSKGAWRERHQQEEWTKRIDISFLHQLGTISARMIKRGEEREEKELLEWGNQIRLIVARVNGDEVNINLSKYRVPDMSVTNKD